ncbi:MAG: BatD family protein [Armatimonadetes bacterium]|nr:BatD family protein [Armatimonadota bacterium]
MAGLLLLAAAALAQSTPDVTVSAEVKPEDCSVGDTVAYLVTVTARDSVARKLEATPPAFSGLETLADPATRQTDQTGQVVFQWSFSLRARTAGTLTIPPFTVSWRAPGGRQPRQAASNPVTVRVRPGGDEHDIRPPKALVDVPDVLRPYRLLLWFLGASALLALFAVGLGWSARVAARRPLPAPEPPPPCHDIALRRLLELEAEGLIEQGRVDAYHIRLSRIVRDYLAERYGFNAVESTTSEIARRLYDDGVASELVALCREVLYGCDLEKFAAHRPTAPEMTALLGRARQLVTRTAASAHGGSR